MTAAYISWINYSALPRGLVLSALIGNSLRLSNATNPFAVALPVTPALTTPLNPFDSITIYDGLSTETVQVGLVGASIGATSIPLLGAGCQFAHAQYTPCSSPGTLGDMGQGILEASRWLEDITHQSLFQTTYTNEILAMPSMRASIGNQSNLRFRPMHYPVTALSALSIQWGGTSTALSYDPTQATIDGQQRTVSVTSLIQLPGGSGPPTSPWPGQPFDRSAEAIVTISYTAGYAASAMPYAVSRACALLCNEVLAGLQENPIGSDSIKQGDRMVTFTLRGDLSGDSLLVKQATKLLMPYTMQIF